MLEPTEKKDGDNHPWGGQDSGEEVEREYNTAAVMVISCNTIQLHPDSLHR